MNRLLVLSFLAFAVLAAPLAAAPSWVPLGPYGGLVDTLTLDPAAAQILYATADTQGTFKSANGGATWTLIHTGNASGNVAVDPSRHTTIYQTLNFNQVLKSADGGATWSSSSRGVPNNAMATVLAVDPAKRTRLYLASDGVWHSLDGGFTWKPANKPLPSGAARHVLALAVARKPASTVFAATGAGVFKSLNAGDSWKSSSLGLPAGEVTTLAMAPSNPQILWASLKGGVFRSTDGGATWSPTAGQPEGAGSIISLAVAPGNPSMAWVGTLAQGAYRTTDAGAHWTPIGPHAATRVAALAASGSTLYAGIAPDFRDPGGVLASGDGGASWQPRNTGLTALEISTVAIDPHHPEILWAAAGAAGLYRSTVGGRVWNLPAQPPAPPTFTSLPTVDGVAFSADGAVLYTAFNGALWRSDDAGNSWQLSLGLETTPSTRVNFFLTDPVNASTLFALTQTNLYASHDYGATWQTLSPPSLGCFFRALAVAPSAPTTLYAGGGKSSGGFFGCRNTLSSLARSEDGGTSWTQADSGLGGLGVTSLAVDPFDARTLYVQTSSSIPAGVWKSTDAGATWLQAGQRAVDDLVFSTDGGTLWGAQGIQVFASHDGAASWQSVGGPQVFHIDRLVPDPVDPNRLYAATWSGVWVLEP